MAHNRDQLLSLGALPFSQRPHFIGILRICQNTQQAPRHKSSGREKSEERNPVFTGKLIGHRDGFGFLRPDQGGDDVFVSPREMLKAMHGDRVSARLSGTDRRGRPGGRD